MASGVGWVLYSSNALLRTSAYVSPQEDQRRASEGSGKDQGSVGRAGGKAECWELGRHRVGHEEVSSGVLKVLTYERGCGQLPSLHLTLYFFPKTS